MTFKLNVRQAVRAINRHHVVMVYPLKTKPHIPSLWGEFFKKSKMKWAWDQGADTRVADLWMFRERLQHSNSVAYLKLFQGRATFVSLTFLELFLASRRLHRQKLSLSAQKMLIELDDNSPQSTKELKKALNLQGRSFESLYQRAAKELWTNGLVVGRGERADGAFPSLLIASTALIFESLSNRAAQLDPQQSHLECLKLLAPTPEFLKLYQSLQKPIS